MKQIPPGPVATGGHTPTQTGAWSLLKPVLRGRCNLCLLCWIYCPDAAIYQEEGRKLRFDYDICKGCGICVRECPLNSIAMVELVAEEKKSVH